MSRLEVFYAAKLKQEACGAHVLTLRNLLLNKTAKLPASKLEITSS